MINYSHDRLEKVLEGTTAEIPENSFLMRMTARTLTAVVNNDTPDLRFDDAHSWTKMVHKEAKEEGIREERARWEDKIRNMFGII